LFDEDSQGELMRKKIYCGILALVGAILLITPAVANKNFAPDWTFKGSSLAKLRTLGGAEWRAESGEIIGTPKTAEGGWLILDRPLQDVQFATTFRCTGGCKAGVMVRTETTPDGIRGVYVQLPDGTNPAATFALKLDAQGREVSRQALRPGSGTVRMLTAPTTPAAGRGGAAAAAPAAPAAARGGQAPAAPATPGGQAAAPAAARGGRGPGGGMSGAMPADSPYARPDYSYKANEWNPLEVILDANILRVWINDGPEGGTTNGQADEDVAAYGPVALYVGGAGEVRFKKVELRDLGRHEYPKEQISSRFRMQRISEYYYGWSATVADVNRDGILDVIAGPFYYLGPDYRISRDIYVGSPSNPATTYTQAAVNFAFDYTGDGWPDVLSERERRMSLYVNPKGEPRRWAKSEVLPTISTEVAIFKDIDGDGKPDAVFTGGGSVSWAAPDPKDPMAVWPVHKVSGPGYTVVAQHGVGAGDINGDGRTDILSPYGWWEQPPKGTPEGPWPYHPVAFGRWPRAGASPGGGEINVYDVNGDGLNDVLCVLEGHDYGIAWFEQKRDKSGVISFERHIIIDDHEAKNPGGVTFSQAHADTIADIDGDGISDFIVGKRYFAHLESYNDPDPFGPPVLYWFKTIRNPKAPGGAEFKPELIHNQSGVGSTVLAVDLNKDGVMDIVTTTNRGTYIFWGKKAAAPAAAKK
jgi:hypothetical protein